MFHPRLGEDPQWALYRARENLELTDPPTQTTPRPRSRAARRGVTAVAVALAVAVTVRADTEPTVPPPDRHATAPAGAAGQSGLAVIPAAPHRRHHAGTRAHHSEPSHAAPAIRPIAAHHRGRTQR